MMAVAMAVLALSGLAAWLAARFPLVPHITTEAEAAKVVAAT